MIKSMRVVARALSIGVALWGASFAHADAPPPSEPDEAVPGEADWKLDVTLSADGSTIYLVGALMDGAYFRVVKLLRESPKVKTLWLGSPGGRSKEGLLIGDLVKKYKLDTYVGHFCGSACTQIFVAGKERLLGPDAQLGFHESYYIADGGDFVTEHTQTDGIELPENFARRSFFDPRLGTMVRLSYERAKLPAEFIEKVFAVPPEEMWRPSRDELKQAGVFTKTVSGAEEIASPTGMHSHIDIEQEMRALPLWGRMAIADPDLFAAAVDEVWVGINSGIDPILAKISGREILTDKVMPLVGYAPDELLDRYILLLGEVAAYQRQHGYPYCEPDGDELKTPPPEQEMQFMWREDILLDEIMAASGQQEKKAMKNAEKEFFKLYGHSVKAGTIPGVEVHEERQKCEVTQQLFEDNVTRKPKDRIKAFRALMQMGEKDVQAKAAAR